MKNKKLFTQIFSTYLILIGFVIVFFTVYEQDALKNFYDAKIEADLIARAHLIADHLLQVDLKQRTELDSIVTRLSASGKVRITLIQPDGNVLADSEKDPKKMDNHADRPEIKHAFEDTVGHSVRYSYTLEEPLVYLAVPLKKDHKIMAAVRVALPLSDFQTSIVQLRNRILIGGIIVLLLGTLFSYFISRRISRPLEDIKRGAERFATGTFNPPLAETGSREIAALSVSLNKMAHELGNRIETISLQRSEQAAMLSSMKEGVLAVDKDERIIRINQAASAFFSIKDNEPRKRFIQEVIRHRAILEFVRDALKQKGHLNRDITLTLLTEQVFRLTSNPLLDANGKPLGILILINEITRLKKLDKMRQEFVANVSHELKTPITSIKGYVETLQDGHGADTETTKKFLSIISHQADRMNAIVTDLLQLSQIEQQEGELSRMQISEERLLPVVESAIDNCRKLANEKSITISILGETDALGRLNGNLVEQAIINLLDNALKYSEEGNCVNIHIEQDTLELRISVQDFGCGIEPKYFDRLFERFYRIDKARSRDAGGTGLGLAIVKHIAMAHQGNITVESLPGKGSTFTIHLPF